RLGNVSQSILYFGVLILLYTIARFTFFFINKGYFDEINTSELTTLMFNGIRYDVSIVCLLNFPLFFLLLFPFKLIKDLWYKRVLHFLFVLVNGVAFLFELADWFYFPYNHARSTAEVLHLITRKGDFVNLLPTFFIQYWYLFIIAFILFYVLHRLF